MMRGKPVIGVSEATTLMFVLLLSRIFLAHIVFIIDAAANAAWMVPIADTIMALAALYLLVAVLKREPGLNLAETGERLVGPYINTGFSLYYLVVFVAGAGLTLRQLSERVLSGFLPDTPISLVSSFILLGSLAVAYLGPEAVARTARFLVSVIVVSTLVLIIMTVPLWQTNAMYPLWGNGLPGILKGIVNNTGDFVYILLLGFIYPFLPGDRALSIGFWSVAAMGASMFIFVLVAILVFAYPTVSELNNPTFEVARMVNLGRFGQRLEILFLPIWMFSNLVFLSISLYAGSSVLATLSRVTDNRPFLFSAAVLTMVVAFMPQSEPQAARWTHIFISRYSFYILVGILLALIGAGLLKGGGKDDGRQNL